MQSVGTGKDLHVHTIYLHLLPVCVKRDVSNLGKGRRRNHNRETEKIRSRLENVMKKKHNKERKYGGSCVTNLGEEIPNFSQTSCCCALEQAIYRKVCQIS